MIDCKQLFEIVRIATVEWTFQATVRVRGKVENTVLVSGARG